MSVALQVAITGLAAGGVYGLVAVGYSLVFRLTGTIAFAFGDLIGLGVFATLLVAVGTGPVSQTSVGGARYALAVVCGVLICIAAGAPRRNSLPIRSHSTSTNEMSDKPIR